MAGQHPSAVDVTPTDLAAIVHTVADFLVVRCVQRAWSTDVVTLWDSSPDARGSLGVYVTAAEVLGCSVVVSDRSQQLSNVQRLPIALVGVGLPSTGHLLRRAEASPGLVEHLEAIPLENLDPSATRDALETPFIEAGWVY